MTKNILVKIIDSKAVITIQTEYSGSLTEDSIIVNNLSSLQPISLLTLIQDGDLHSVLRAVRAADRELKDKPAQQDGTFL